VLLKRERNVCIPTHASLHMLQALGIALTVVAGLVKTHRTDMVENINLSEDDINEVMPASDVNVALAGGCLLMIVGLVGIVGACKHEGKLGKVLLCVYSLFLLVVIVLEIAAFALVMVVTKRLDDFSNDVGANKLEKINKKVMNFVNDTRCACCKANWTGMTCGPNAGSKADSDACSLLDDIVTQQNCPTNKAFTKPIVDYVNKRLRAVSVFALVVAIIQIITFCAACCLICKRKKDQQNASNAQPAQNQGGAQKGQNVVYA